MGDVVRCVTKPSRGIGLSIYTSRHIVLLTCIVLHACTPPTQDPSLYTERHSRVVFRNTNIVHPERNEVVRGRTVYVEHGRIVSVAPPGEEQIPADVYEIDAEDAYLLSGLGDMHVHHYPDYDDADLLLYLVNGVTTVRNMRGTDRDLDAKRRIADGTLLGPRYITCGPHLSWGRGARTPTDAELSVHATAEAGYDCVKVYPVRSEEAFLRLVGVADSLGIPTAGHFQWALPLAFSLRLGSGEHLESPGLQNFFGHRMPSQELHGTIARQIAESGIFVTPTIGTMDLHRYQDEELLQALFDREETRYVPQSVRKAVRDKDDWIRTFDDFQAHYERTLAITEFLHDHGVPLLLGTDAGGVLTVPGFAVHDELRTLVAAGLTPAEALTTGTVNVAAFLRSNGGRIEPGRDADLILLDANPLENVSHVEAIRGVLIGEVWIDADAINLILAHLEK